MPTRLEMLEPFERQDPEPVQERWIQPAPTTDVEPELIARYWEELSDYHPPNNAQVTVPIQARTSANRVYIQLKGGVGVPAPTKELFEKLCFAPKTAPDGRVTLVNKPMPAESLRLANTGWRLHTVQIESTDKNGVTLFWSHDHPNLDELYVSRWRW